MLDINSLPTNVTQLQRLLIVEHAIVATQSAAIIPLSVSPSIGEASRKELPKRRKRLPEHFERINNILEPAECACPDCGGPLGLLGTDTAQVLEAMTGNVPGDPAYPPEEALLVLLDHRAGLGAGAAHREELCRCLAVGAYLELEICVLSAVVSAVPDFCACRVDAKSHDADAMGGSQQRTARTVGRGIGQTCFIRTEYPCG